MFTCNIAISVSYTHLDVYKRQVLMSGEGSTPAAYNPDIFSKLRICIAPIICLLGYLLNVVGIIYITKKNN